MDESNWLEKIKKKEMNSMRWTFILLLMHRWVQTDRSFGKNLWNLPFFQWYNLHCKANRHYVNQHYNIRFSYVCYTASFYETPTFNITFLRYSKFCACCSLSTLRCCRRISSFSTWFCWVSLARSRSASVRSPVKCRIRHSDTTNCSFVWHSFSPGEVTIVETTLTK
jgi:hypothetical protein